MSLFATAPSPFRACAIGLLALASLALLAGLASVVALAGLRRLAPDTNLLAATIWLWLHRDQADVQRWLQIGLATAGIGTMSIGISVLRRLTPSLHGRARFATESDLRRDGFRAKHGLILGRKGGRFVVFGGPEHVMLYAPTRTGKGVGVVIPNLLNWPDSVVVLDIKQENWAASASFRAAHGHEVILFDPLDPEGRSARYNPLGHIDRDDAAAVLDELQKIAGMLFPPPDRSDAFWSEAARTGFIGVGALVAASPPAPFSLGEIYRQLTTGDPRQRLKQIVSARAEAGRPLPAGCTLALSDFCSASENTFAGVRQTITARMNLWLNPRVAAATEVSDFDLRLIRDRRMAIYLGASPDNLDRVAPLYNLFFQQLIDLNTRSLPTAERHRVPVLVLLDEFARLGRAPVIAQGFSYVAGYGLRLLPVLQSPAQLRSAYGPDLAEEIIANCGVEIAFAPKELKVAQELSDRLGHYTFEARSRTGPAGFSGGRRSQTASDNRRPLMFPQELIQMSRGDLLVLRAGMPPVRGRKIAYYREQRFMDRVRAPPVIPAQALVTLTWDPDAAYGTPLSGADAGPPPSTGPVRASGRDPLTLEAALPTVKAAGLEPLAADASTAEIEAWVDQLVDAGVRQVGATIESLESNHVR